MRRYHEYRHMIFHHGFAVDVEVCVIWIESMFSVEVLLPKSCSLSVFVDTSFEVRGASLLDPTGDVVFEVNRMGSNCFGYCYARLASHM